MFDRLEVMLKRYNEITQLLCNMPDIKEMTKLLKEQKSLEEACELYTYYLKLDHEIKQLKNALKNETEIELKELMEVELETSSMEYENLLERLKIVLLPKDENDDKNIIMEIKGAAGGDEGNIFAGDLFRMYTKYAENLGLRIELLNVSHGSMGGYSSIEFALSGENVYSKLKYESGVHRVQRVPLTESMGRVHTSTAVVLVMPEAEEINLDIKWVDIKVDVYRSSGAGGQSVNTTDSAVRLTYLPTGLAVACQEGRSQHENKETAFRLLKARLYEEILNEKLAKESQERKELGGRGDRSEKIRTYNYPQNRVTDHRIGLTLQRLDAVMDGRLDLIIDELINETQKRLLLGKINE